jgi:molecular chaperone HtpG
MPEKYREIPFKVDMAGIIEILGCSLYSRRDTAIRELLQNAHDAILRRRAQELDFLGAIRVSLNKEAKLLTVHDDGIGITLDEAEQYLGTLGSGISGLLKKSPGQMRGHDKTGIIGQFGVGLFSAFLLADKIVVESRKTIDHEAVHWEAGTGTSILLGLCSREELGTSVTLHLSDENSLWADDPELLKKAVRHYADFIPVPIFFGDKKRRMNVMTPSWYEPSPDEEMVSMELEQRFEDNPLDVMLLNKDQPKIRGAIYITRQRTPGFSGRPLVTATVRRMVISARIDGLFPEWGSFYRGVLELPELQPTTSREDLIRNDSFQHVKQSIEAILLERLFELQKEDLVKLQSILTWHRYSFAGAALDQNTLRHILSMSYLFSTTIGPLTFSKIVEHSQSEDYSKGGEMVLWVNTDQRQEQWISGVFESHNQPCVQALKTFESTLLTLMVSDLTGQDQPILVQSAHPGNERFVEDVLSIRDLREVSDEWQDFFSMFDVRVRFDSFDSPLAVLAFPRRDVEIRRDFESLKKDGRIPAAFSRMMDQHFSSEDVEQSQIILNTKHQIVSRALKNSIHSPLASVLRILVSNALMTAGAIPGSQEQQTLRKDLDWIAETIVPKGDK